MNLKIGSAVKAIALLLGLVLGADFVSDTKLDQIAGAVTVLGTVAYDLWETFRLHKQGIVSTVPAANVEAMSAPATKTPEKLAAEEKKPA